MLLTVTPEEAARMLHMSVQSVYKLVRRGTLMKISTPGGRRYAISLWSLLLAAGVPEAEVRVLLARSLDQVHNSEPPSSVATRGPAGVGHQRASGRPNAEVGPLPRPADHGTVNQARPPASSRASTSRGRPVVAPARQVKVWLDHFHRAERRAREQLQHG